MTQLRALRGETTLGGQQASAFTRVLAGGRPEGTDRPGDPMAAHGVHRGGKASATGLNPGASSEVFGGPPEAADGVGARGQGGAAACCGGRGQPPPTPH